MVTEIFFKLTDYPVLKRIVRKRLNNFPPISMRTVKADDPKVYHKVPKVPLIPGFKGALRILFYLFKLEFLMQA